MGGSGREEPIITDSVGGCPWKRNQTWPLCTKYFSQQSFLALMVSYRNDDVGFLGDIKTY